MYILLQVVSLFLVYYGATTQLYPHTLTNTEIRCDSQKDCEVHYNNSWCASAGVMCIHHYCKLIPDYPCRTSTQHCQEVPRRECIDKTCLTDSDCDNGIYCDGIEICSASNKVCITDPERPSCLYTGGQCDEASQTCHQPKVRIAWRSTLSELEKRHGGKALSSTTIITANDVLITGNEVISQDTAGITSLIIIGAFTGLVAIVAVIAVIGRALNGIIGYSY